MPPRRPLLGSRPRQKPQLTRSITVEVEGPNQPQAGRLIPWPEVPTYPVLTNLQLLAPQQSFEDAGEQGGLLTLGQPFFTTAGRTALGWAFRASGLLPGDGVLLPAYHCLAMLEPIEWLGLKPIYYRLREDMSIDYFDLEGRLDHTCKALVVVHYFGFPQDGPRLRALCDSLGLSLIEDCAHSFFGSDHGHSLGSFGDFAVGSLPKFFPLRGGGCLASSRHRLPQQNLAAQGPIANLQALVRELQIAHYYGRLRPLSPATIGAAASAKLLVLLGLGPDLARLHGAASSLEYTADRLAKSTLRSCAPEQIASRRRQNYQTISQRLADLPEVTLLKPHLSPGVVPYMVPLRIPALRRIFATLEDRAVPMQRFGQFLAPNLDASLCSVSSDLSHHGLQLPCHQSLRSDEIDWMIEQVSDVCRAAGAG